MIGAIQYINAIGNIAGYAVNLFIGQAAIFVEN